MAYAYVAVQKKFPNRYRVRSEKLKGGTSVEGKGVLGGRAEFLHILTFNDAGACGAGWQRSHFCCQHPFENTLEEPLKKLTRHSGYRCRAALMADRRSRVCKHGAGIGNAEF